MNLIIATGIDNIIISKKFTLATWLIYENNIFEGIPNNIRIPLFNCYHMIVIIKYYKIYSWIARYIGSPFSNVINNINFLFNL